MSRDNLDGSGLEFDEKVDKDRIDGRVTTEEERRGISVRRTDIDCIVSLVVELVSNDCEKYNIYITSDGRDLRRRIAGNLTLRTCQNGHGSTLPSSGWCLALDTLHLVLCSGRMTLFLQVPHRVSRYRLANEATALPRLHEVFLPSSDFGPL